ncbi:MAG: glycoside hydrolase family 16 protein [Vicinamibacteria bacterium]|nr:glycoside hydrolase family 16 protein [Vicinamibacteria bacterium]
MSIDNSAPRTAFLTLAGIVLSFSFADSVRSGTRHHGVDRERDHGRRETASPGHDSESRQSDLGGDVIGIVSADNGSQSISGDEQSSAPQPLGVGGTWALVFQDEFEGTSLDLSKWRPNWFGATDESITKPINDREASCYDPAQVTVSGGQAHLTAVSVSKPGCVKKDGSPAEYASGIIMSDGHHEFTYGFVEARIYLPPGTGTPCNWSAFWTDGQEWPQDGEIDIMETLGGGGYARWTYHYDADTGPGENHQAYTLGGNLLAESGWHVFGADWQPDLITFYYDGVDVGSVASSDLQGGASITGSPQYIIVNLGLDENYEITVPSTLMVDYVRQWIRVAKKPTGIRVSSLLPRS